MSYIINPDFSKTQRQITLGRPQKLLIINTLDSPKVVVVAPKSSLHLSAVAKLRIHFNDDSSAPRIKNKEKYKIDKMKS